MNILITGNLSSLVIPLSRELVRNKNKVILASSNAKEIDISTDRSLSLHSINPADTVFRDVFDSYKFDIIIFLSTREEQYVEQRDRLSVGQQLDGLRNTLEMARRGDVKRFLYLSSTEVYGNAADISESALPHPISVNGDLLLMGEKYCRNYHKDYGLPITILRLPNLYGPEEKTGLLYRLVYEGKLKDEIIIQVEPETLCSFLHVDDVIDFIKRTIDEEYFPEALVINLSSSKPIKISTLADILKRYFSVVIFADDHGETIYTMPTPVSSARKLYHWFDLHDITSEIEDYIQSIKIRSVNEQTYFQKLKNWATEYKSTLKWVELIGGAMLAIYLSELTGTLIQFQYVDFRLVYVVILGSVYGLQSGLIASTLMSLFVLYTWLNLGVDWKLLVYNVGNWFPFVLYLAAGMLTGYNHDKAENAIIYEKQQHDFVVEKYSFLYEVFKEIRDLKDEYRERLIGYRDSFGKIFTITRELDELQELAVYLRALSILEEIMQNNSIAIYSLDKSRTYARLEVHSADMGSKIAKTLNLDSMPQALESIEHGKIFQNTELLENYPAYIAPVLNNSYPFNVPVALIVIWVANFDQHSIYYYNLFKVICGMIEASLVRATSFLDANYEKIYLPTTRIMNPDAFADIVKLRIEMKKNKISDFQLVRVEILGEDIGAFYQRISEGIRSVDVVGMLWNGDCYILLTQSDRQSSLEVLKRLMGLGIVGYLAEPSEIVLV